jgi:hypothetical protein
MEVSGQLHAPRRFTPEKSPRYPFYRELDVPQIQFGRRVKVNNLLPLPEIELRYID